MNHRFVADGPVRFIRAQRRAETVESIQKKYAAELAQAAPEQKSKLQEKMAQEILQREKALNHTPSAGTLW